MLLTYLRRFTIQAPVGLEVIQLDWVKSNSQELAMKSIDMGFKSRQIDRSPMRKAKCGTIICKEESLLIIYEICM